MEHSYYHPDAAKPIAPCITQNRSYDARRCKPTKCQAPFTDACRLKRVEAETRGKPKPERALPNTLRCIRCRQRKPLNQYAAAAELRPENDRYVCMGCKAGRKRETMRELYARKKASVEVTT